MTSLIIGQLKLVTSPNNCLIPNSEFPELGPRSLCVVEMAALNGYTRENLPDSFPNCCKANQCNIITMSSYNGCYVFTAVSHIIKPKIVYPECSKKFHRVICQSSRSVNLQSGLVSDNF